MQRQEDQEEEEVLSSKKDMLPNGVSYIDLCTAEQSTFLCDAYYVFFGGEQNIFSHWVSLLVIRKAVS